MDYVNDGIKSNKQYLQRLLEQPKGELLKQYITKKSETRGVAGLLVGLGGLVGLGVGTGLVASSSESGPLTLTGECASPSSNIQTLTCKLGEAAQSQ